MVTITGSVGKGGLNRPQDVRSIQSLLNNHLHFLVPMAPLVVNGLVSPNLFFAIEEYQRRIVKMHRPDGRVDPNGHTLRSLAGSATHALPTHKAANPADAPWIATARAEIGTREIRGSANNSPRVLEYIGTFPYLKNIWHDEKKKDYKMGDADETPWCACFVNWCLIKAGKPKGPSARAKDWASYGTKLDQPRVGAICVVYRAPKHVSSGVTASGYHVAFWTGSSGNSLTLLGGNQTTGDRTTEEVNEKTTHGYWTVQALRWPT